ncbi:MAG: hypothetical protein ACK559_03880, partial [bacterium]
SIGIGFSIFHFYKSRYSSKRLRLFQGHVLKESAESHLIPAVLHVDQDAYDAYISNRMKEDFAVELEWKTLSKNMRQSTIPKSRASGIEF